MKAKVISLTTDPHHAMECAIDEITRGGVILFPTETVYGLGVTSSMPESIEVLYELKGRPREKPFQWLTSSVEVVRNHALEWSPEVDRLARAFWPGPMTLVLNSKEGSIGWRVPRHEWLLKFLEKLGVPLVATSANPAHEPPCATAEEGLQKFSDSIQLVLDGGAIHGGIPSSVVRCESGKIQILREGAISKQQLVSCMEGSEPLQK